MKHKTIFITALLFCFLLTGCQLAKPDAEQTVQEDRLIGVLITREYLDLFDAEGYFNDNVNKILSGGEISSEEQAAYQGRLYAQLEDQVTINEDGEEIHHHEYVFPGIEGYPHFVARIITDTDDYVAATSDPSISSGKLNLNYSDTGESIEFSGTLYVSTDAGQLTHYINPVYQDAEGRVYATTGNGMSADFNADGMRHSTNFNVDSSFTEDGTTKTYHFNYEITVEAMTPATEIRLLQMNEQHEILSTQHYKPGEMPTDLTPEADTAYLIVEQQEKDGITRQLLDYGDETIVTYEAQGDFICRQKSTWLHWPEQK